MEDLLSILGSKLMSDRIDTPSSDFLRKVDRLDEVINKFNDILRQNNSQGTGSSAHRSSTAVQGKEYTLQL